MASKLRYKIFFIFLGSFLTISFNSVYAQFTQGNLVVMRVGPGTTNAATPLSLVEYTTAGVLSGYSVTLPSSGNPQITNSASATSEGLISLSGERDRIIIPGYDAVVNTAAIASTAVATYNRELFSVNAAGTIVKLGVTTTQFNNNNIRSGTACSTNYYGSGANSGIVSMDGSNSVISNTSPNNRQLNIYNGQLYFSTGSATHGIYQVGTGVPTTTGQVSTNIINTGGASSNYGFAISPDGLTCYIADDAGQGITKYTRPNTASAFTFAYTVANQDARGLTADFTTSPYTIYITSTATSPNTILKIIDNGPSSVFTILATAPPTYVFRGIVFVPLASPCMTLTPTVTNVNCNGNGTGAINLATSGYPATGFYWTGPGAFTATTQNITNLAAGTYTIVATSASGKTGCTAMATVNVTQPAVLTATTSQTNVSCNAGNNGTATVNPSGGTSPYTYSWAPSGGTAATASGLVAGSYTCTITDNKGCSIAKTFTITEPSALTATTSQSNVSCYGGSDGTATVNPSGGTPSYTYLWAPSGGSNATATGLATGSYTCTITDNNNCSINKIVTITQPLNPLTATTSQTNVSCNGGSNGTATVNVSGGTPGYTYTWGPSGGTGATGIGLSAGSYTCSITDSKGCPLQEVFNITEPTQLSATTSQTNIDCNGGSNGTATVNASGGTPNYTYSWAPFGGSAATATGLIAGTYTCTITDSKGCSIAPTVTILQAALMTASIGGTATICDGSNTIITFTATPNTTITYTANAASQTIVVGATGTALLTVNPSVTTTYSLITIQDNTVPCTQLVSGSVTVTVNPVPAAPVTADLVYCQLENTTALTAAGQNLLWYTNPVGGIGDPSAPIPSSVTAGTYTWYVTQSALGCESQRSPLQVLIKPQPAAPTSTSQTAFCQLDTPVQLTAVGDSLLWYANATGGTGNIIAPTPSTNTAGVFTFYVSQTINGCESPRLPVAVTVTTKPQPPATQNISYCQDDIAMPLTAQGQNLLWYTAPTGGTADPNAPVPSTLTTGIKVWYVSQVIAGCESDRSVLQVTVYDRPLVSIFADSSHVCKNATLTFTYTGSTLPGATYSWIMPLGASIISGTGAGPLVIKFTQPGTNIITLAITTGNGTCTASGSYSVNVIDIPVADIGMPSRACAGDTVNISIPVASPGIADYQWDFSGGAILRTPTNTDGTYWLRWTDAGLHTVRLTVISAQQCPSFTATADINIHPLPDARMSDIANNICASDTVTFSALVYHKEYTYKWTPDQFFNVDEDSSLVRGIMQFPHDVVLTVYDDYGCAASSTKYINAKPCCEVFFPTAFSPNGDGRNDFFRPLGAGHHNIRIFKVMDRWGQSVFSTANEIPGWDGKYQGVPQEIGIYYYYIKFECIDGRIVEQTGDVTLVR